MDTQKYYLGLDMGTSSVGWAVTDQSYRLIRKKGKDLWGIREFETAETSAKRRMYRTGRRRLQREAVRKGYLKLYFEQAIAKVDPYFFQRLENSKYHCEDKDEEVRTPNGIFNDPDYTDRDYFDKYPTIFHLREELIKNPQPHDVRLVYLAILNIFKHRGHFLNSGLSDLGSLTDIQETYDSFCSLLQENHDISFPGIDAERLKEILGDNSISRTKKAENAAALFGINKKSKREYAFIKAMCGLKVDAKLLFDIESDENENIEIDFSGSFEEKASEINDIIGSDAFSILEAMKSIHDTGMLSGLLGDEKYLSSARVRLYKKHKADLKLLKELVRKYCSKEEYDNLFRNENEGNYSAYVHSNNSGHKQRRDMKGCKREDFYSAVKKLMKKMPAEDKSVSYIVSEIEKETFMPKQLTGSNGIIPNQLHAVELRAILSNAENYLPFLKEKDEESGLSISERIIKLFSFQIPYFVGPITENSCQNGGNGWVVRKEAGSVLPWNIDSKIDLKKTSEEFIMRLVRKCTYLNDEKVLPKESLLYERFRVLNEINNIRIDGERIPVSVKQDIFNLLFMKGKKVSRKQLEEYFLARGFIKSDEQLTGIDKTINNHLSSYGKFKALFGDVIDTDAGKQMAEHIIFWCTVYGDSKAVLVDVIKEHYPEFDEKTVKRICGFKFKDWGNLSKEFLQLKGCNAETGEITTLIRELWESNNNLNELLHSEQYTFGEELEEKHRKLECRLSEFSAEDLNDYYFSAPVRKMVWQTLLVIKEIEGVMGGAPERIFIETTRNDQEKGDKGRTVSRKAQLLDLYNSVKDDSRNWKELIEKEDASGRLKSKKMYLYLTQMGRDMYTGKSIDLEDLFDDNKYDIDHIYPRHYVKDDSINNNLVLTYKPINSDAKKDVYPLSEGIRNNPDVRKLWKILKDKKLITEEKYRRLSGTQPFSDEQKAGFIARQLVETSQSTKAIADLLKQLIPESDIVYSKASNVSDFRHDRNMLKSRLVNEFHHAQDAYLNIVVGNAYYVKFTKNPLNYIRNEYKERGNDYHLSKMFDRDIVRGSETAWVAQRKGGVSGTIETVKKVMAKNSPLLSRQSFEGHGEISNATLYSHRKAEKVKGVGYIPLKTSDPKMADVTRYGGFSSVSTAYFILVEHTVKGKRVRTLEIIPVYIASKIKGREALENYCKNELGLIESSVRIEKINLQSQLRINGYNVHISGKTGNQILLRNAEELHLPADWVTYIKKLENVQEAELYLSVGFLEKNTELYDILLEKHSTGVFSRRPNSLSKKLKEGRDTFIKLGVNAQCRLLLQLLQLSSIGTSTADLTDIGGSSHSGKMLINKDISNCKECLLINNSVTGIYRTEVDLLKI